MSDQQPSAVSSGGPEGPPGASPEQELAESMAEAPVDAGVGVAPDLEAAAEAVESDISSLERERDDYLDALRRLQADFENFRKRTMRQQTDILERAAQALVEKLLPVLDAADLAIAHGGGEAVGQVAGLLMDTLVKEGLEGVDPKPGDPFDPTVHEAVAHEPGEGGGQEVADLLRAGYRWKGQLLRPAMVKVRG